VAEQAGIPTWKPERVGSPEMVETLRTLAADLGVVVAYGQFMGRRVREAPGLGYCINAHASLLPRYRGAAPIARAILAGEEETGVSIMRVEREMDAGPVCAVVRTRIGPDESTGELSQRLAALSADLVAQCLDDIVHGGVRWTPQDESQASLAPKLERAEARIDWQRSARELSNLVRAMAPRPGATTTADGEALRILSARPLPGPVELAPGTVRVVARRGLRIATGEGWLAPGLLQRAGGRPLDVETFLNGRGLTNGQRLGP
jgi:methionyl-tRNA formyltransferase